LGLLKRAYILAKRHIEEIALDDSVKLAEREKFLVKLKKKVN